MVTSFLLLPDRCRLSPKLTGFPKVEVYVTANDKNRYAHIDGMRALAVILVVVAHAGLGEIVPGGSGVTIFFSISGFIISYLLLRESDATGGFRIRAFYLRRALKIGPPLLVCIIIPTLILAVVKPINWSPFIGILLFYFNWFKAAHGDAPLPGSGVVWSLSIEEQFYLGFAIVWLIILKSRARIRWLTVIATVAVVWSMATRLILASSSGVHADRIYYGSDTRLDAIAWGVLAAIAFHHSINHAGRIQSLVRLCSRDFALIAAIVIYLTSLAIRDEWFRDTFRFTLQPIAACIVILYGFGNNRSPVRVAFNAIARIRIVQLIGLASYSIYLVHMIAMYYSDRWVDPLPRAVSLLALIIVGIVPGVFVYLGVERPVQRMRYRQQSLRQAGEPADEQAVAATTPTSRTPVDDLSR
jgi:peptidoglycan/LPS O-acetylase OafA/YrhL